MAQYAKTTATVVGGHVGMGMGGDGRMSYIPIISYRYEINGQQYMNDRYTQNAVGRRIQSQVQKIIDKYPPNSTIEIFYNVDNPSDSFVQKGFGKGVNRFLWLMAIGAILASIATLAFAQSQGIISLF